ncbi:MAG: hypothetical protein ACXAEN_17840 [Candidatus Thorarchaeota archaeon]|jgi:hypothetical protein
MKLYVYIPGFGDRFEVCVSKTAPHIDESDWGQDCYLISKDEVALPRDEALRLFSAKSIPKNHLTYRTLDITVGETTKLKIPKKERPQRSVKKRN